MFVVVLSGTRTVGPFDDATLDAVPEDALHQLTVDARLHFFLNAHLRGALPHPA